MTDFENRGYSNTPVLRTDKTPAPVGTLRILVDWLGFTFNTDDISISEVLDFFEGYLGIDRNAFKPGRKYYEGYASSLFFENINIYYEGASNQGIHVDITGQGCRFLDFYYQRLRVQDQNKLTGSMFRVHTWYDFFRLLDVDPRIKLTRLDIAADDFHGYLNIHHIFQKCLAGELTMKFRSWAPAGKFDSDGNTAGLSLYFGSDDSDLQCVMYEKDKQLGLDYHWKRVELRFTRKRANEMMMHILSSNHEDIGIHFAGILKNYLTFRMKKESDSNKRRWPVAPWWDNFLQGIPKLQIAASLPDRSIVRSKKWVNDQVSRTIARLYFAYQGIDENWMVKILQEGTLKLDNEDLNMIQEFRRIYGKDSQKLLRKDNPFNENEFKNKKESERNRPNS